MTPRTLDIVTNPDADALCAEALSLTGIRWSDPIGGFVLLVPSCKEMGLTDSPLCPPPGTRVIAVRNNFLNGIANGDLGVVTAPNHVTFSGTTLSYGPEFRPGDVLSFHAAQGQRFRTVAALLTDSRSVPPGKGLRVALAAAKERLILFAAPDLLAHLFRDRAGRPAPEDLAGFMHANAPANWAVAWNGVPWFATAPPMSHGLRPTIVLQP